MAKRPFLTNIKKSPLDKVAKGLDDLKHGKEDLKQRLKDVKDKCKSIGHKGFAGKCQRCGMRVL